MKQNYEIQAAHTLAMIVGTFIVLWTPGIACIFWMSVSRNRDFPLDLIQFTTILVHLNAAIDPIIYAYRMNNIREAMKTFFSCCKRSIKVAPVPVNLALSEPSSRTASTKTSSSDIHV